MAGITSEGDYKPHLFPVSNLILGISRKGDNHLMGQTDGQILRAHYMHIIITHTHNITLCAQHYSKSFSITSLTLSLCLFFRWENCSTGSKRPAQIPTKRDRDLNRYTVPCVHPAKRDSTPANRAAGSDPTIMWRWQMKTGHPRTTSLDDSLRERYFCHFHYVTLSLWAAQPALGLRSFQ